MILGIDEVGRGPWAGPLVVGAVVLGCEIDGLTDSKKLSAKRRVELAAEINEKAAAVGLGWVHAGEIDTLGLGPALYLACQRAVKEIDALGVAYHEIIIDGTINLLKDTSKGAYVTCMKKADLLIPAVSAASIVAKVARDEYMSQQSLAYPEYGFASHVGYGTARHIAAIEEYGVTPLHRLSFAPLAKYPKENARKNVPSNTSRTVLDIFDVETSTATGSHPLAESEAIRTIDPGVDSGMISTKRIGDRAEDVVAEYLQASGHEILERNWKTKFCEIDIVSQKEGTVYFTEVKYRKNGKAGGGIAAITPKKLRQMKFAAEYFTVKNKLLDVNLRLAAADVTEADFHLKQWLEIKT